MRKVVAGFQFQPFPDLSDAQASVELRPDLPLSHQSLEHPVLLVHLGCSTRQPRKPQHQTDGGLVVSGCWGTYPWVPTWAKRQAIDSLTRLWATFKEKSLPFDAHSKKSWKKFHKGNIPQGIFLQQLGSRSTYKTYGPYVLSDIHPRKKTHMDREREGKKHTTHFVNPSEGNRLVFFKQIQELQDLQLQCWNINNRFCLRNLQSQIGISSKSRRKNRNWKVKHQSASLKFLQRLFEEVILLRCLSKAQKYV